MKQLIICTAALTTLTGSFAYSADSVLKTQEPTVFLQSSTIVDLSQDVHRIQMKTGLSCLSVAVIQNKQLFGLGSSGKGGVNQNKQLKIEDPFIIASCSKIFTSTLAAKLIENGVLRWNSTFAEVFPELDKKINATYRDVTLEQLLSHTAGAPERDAFWRSNELRQASAFKGDSREQRLFLLKAILKNRTEYTPGTKYVYSNAGYYMAAAMLERAANKKWEDMIATEIFAKVPMPSASATSTVDPLLTMPAGGISCSLADLAHFCCLHMMPSVSEPLLSSNTFSKMHTPCSASGYALGVLVVTRDWAKGSAYTHRGVNNVQMTEYWLAPETGFGLVVATTNDGSQTASKLDKALVKLIQLYATH